MGLLQWAVQTYDTYESLIGQGNTQWKTPFAPIYHAIKNADVEIILNRDGSFNSAFRIDKGARPTIIPVTDLSLGRSGKKISPHPLCDQIEYIFPGGGIKYDEYNKQLDLWINSRYSHDKLIPISSYVKRGSIINDLSSVNVIKTDDKGNLSKNEYRLLVRWRVLGCGDVEECCKDYSLILSFQNYQLSKQKEKPHAVCMISGEEQVISTNHMKGVVSKYSNAKLISSNKDQGFSYLGRFRDAIEAVSVGYISSQKAHIALKWLSDNQGDLIGNRMYISWCPQGIELPKCTYSLRESAGHDPIKIPSDYKNVLKEALNSWKNDFRRMKQANAVVVIFDAASDGRLAVTYYNELMASDFLQRLYEWDESCAWFNHISGVQSPYLKQIAECAYGVERGNRIEADDKIIAEQVQRLVRCRIDRQSFPENIKRMLVQRASEPHKYEKNWEKVLFTACAVIRKYHYDHKKEALGMALDKDRNDRSYQYGRLLAILEKVERDTYRGEVAREPNAIRRMSVFCKRPYHTFVQLEQIIEQAYISQLKTGSRVRYKQSISEILNKLDEMGALSDDIKNRPLDDTYLIGYYLQRDELYRKKEELNVNNNHEEED